MCLAVSDYPFPPCPLLRISWKLSAQQARPCQGTTNSGLRLQTLLPCAVYWLQCLVAAQWLCQEEQPITCCDCESD